MCVCVLSHISLPTLTIGSDFHNRPETPYPIVCQAHDELILFGAEHFLQRFLGVAALVHSLKRVRASLKPSEKAHLAKLDDRDKR